MSRVFGDITKPAPPLPQRRLEQVGKGISRLLPLSRRGHGPGLIILGPDHNKQLSIESGIPSTLVKWAEEGYVVVEIQESALASGNALQQAVQAIQSCEQCDEKEKIGLVAYGPQYWNSASKQVSSVPQIVASVVYADSNGIDTSTAGIPLVVHVAGTPARQLQRSKSVTEYSYPNTTSYKFAYPFQPEFHYSTEAVSHTRNLTFLKRKMDGPWFDLEDIWEEHTYYEFQDRSVEWTMSTMVQEPYVNHVPTLTGGVGREALTKFYRDNFIFNNSADTDLELISRTTGIDRVIDEFLFKFTHDMVVDWMLPGIPPTFKKAVVPFTAVVNIRGDRLYHEHISWDQGTLLRQLGLMPEYLPYPYPVTGDQATNHHGPIEYRLPVEGEKTAQMLRDRGSVPSNEMFNFKIREAKSP